VIEAEKKAKVAHVWARDPNDWYVEEAWVNRRLFEEERFEGPIWDPAAGMCRMPDAARAAGYDAIGSDLVSRGYGEIGGVDFLSLQQPLKVRGQPARSIASNPPFGICEADIKAGRPIGFVEHALRLAEHKVAMVLPARWLWGDERSRWLEKSNPRRVYILTPRPSMPPGAVIAAGIEPGGGDKDFLIIVWLRGYDGPFETRWLRRDGA
jgi:hypothetical protein